MDILFDSLATANQVLCFIERKKAALGG